MILWHRSTAVSKMRTRFIGFRLTRLQRSTLDEYHDLKVVVNKPGV